MIALERRPGAEVLRKSSCFPDECSDEVSTMPQTTSLDARIDMKTLETVDWRATRATGELLTGEGITRLEPKVMDLLFLLASRPDHVVTKDEIMTAIWPGVVVGEDTLARAISRLRRALGDDPKSARYIETLPKRGYRFVAERKPVTAPHIQLAPADTCAAVRQPAQMHASAPRRWFAPIRLALGSLVLGLTLLTAGAVMTAPSSALAAARESVERANDYYFQYSRADNEAAIELYQRIIDREPDYAPAYSGLANALVQRVIRWPQGANSRLTQPNLAQALASGQTTTANGRWTLERALELAQQSVRLSPNDPASHKALGFVLSAQQNFEAALSAYHRAVALDPDAWGPMINIADVLEISGHSDAALPYLENAYAAMTRVYEKETARIRPWYAEIAVLIGDRHRDHGDSQRAAVWYRQVLAYAPFHEAATQRLVALMTVSGQRGEAARLCDEFERRIGRTEACGQYRG